ncbi:MAG: hypothetical protein JNM99_04680 [Verrucomicrobiaceae bacterium]|nr:hypothetical protein [Verrucomicrobiaceae bacterium]
MTRIELSQADIADIEDAMDDPSLSDKVRHKPLVIRMHSEGAKGGSSPGASSCTPTPSPITSKSGSRAASPLSWRIVTTGPAGSATACWDR